MANNYQYNEKPFKKPIYRKFSNAISNQFRIIREINKKYKNPRIKMTRWVSIALLGLRLYLILLVIILVYKFITLVM